VVEIEGMLSWHGLEWTLHCYLPFFLNKLLKIIG